MPSEVHINQPYLDFKFGNNYASDFNLIRVSDGSRYNNNLLPTLTDKTTEIPGGDGMYWFNTYYKQRQISINVAFEHVTESNLRNIRNWLNGKEVKPLIFDELPDRQYFAKVTGTPSLKYIPFDEPTTIKLPSNTMIEEVPTTNDDTITTEVIYKGEGTIQFTCYDPFAYAATATSQTYKPAPPTGQSKYTPDTRITVEGTAPSTFTVSTNNALASDITIQILNNDNQVLYFITLKEAITGSFNWNSSTGMVTAATLSNSSAHPVQYIGNGMGTLNIGDNLYVKCVDANGNELTGDAGAITVTFSFYNRYL